MTQLDLLRVTLDALDAAGIPYAIVGSIASGVFGEPRMTQDIDIVIDPEMAQIDALCDAFPSPDFYVSRDAARQALRDREMFNVIHPATGNKVDFMVARRDEWGVTRMSRRQRVAVLPDREGYTASPEDVILGKLWYYQIGGSEKHLRDITGILRVTANIDLAYVAQWAAELDVADVWHAVLQRLTPPSH